MIITVTAAAREGSGLHKLVRESHPLTHEAPMKRTLRLGHAAERAHAPRTSSISILILVLVVVSVLVLVLVLLIVSL